MVTRRRSPAAPEPAQNAHRYAEMLERRAAVRPPILVPMIATGAIKVNSHYVPSSGTVGTACGRPAAVVWVMRRCRPGRARAGRCGAGMSA